MLLGFNVVNINYDLLTKDHSDDELYSFIEKHENITGRKICYKNITSYRYHNPNGSY